MKMLLMKRACDSPVSCEKAKLRPRHTSNGHAGVRHVSARHFAPFARLLEPPSMASANSCRRSK